MHKNDKHHDNALLALLDWPRQVVASAALGFGMKQNVDIPLLHKKMYQKNYIYVDD